MIRRIIALLLLTSLQLFAQEYDDTLLSIEAKLFPKIAMLEKHIKEKESSTLSFVIVAEEVDISTAEVLKSKILKNYPDKILNKKIHIEIKKPRDILEMNIDAIIVLHHSSKTLKEIALWANRHNILTFSYDPYDLQYGIAASIYLGKSTKPYINTTSINKYNFIFDPYLLGVSKFLK